MDRLLTPLLRRVYWLFAAFVVAYVAVLGYQGSQWYKERLYQKLLAGNDKERAAAGFDLAYLKGETQLVRALKSASPAVRVVAVNSLWDLWSRAAGRHAYRQMQAAQQAATRQAFPEALQLLSQVTQQYPAFAEGWNRRATLLWELGRFQEAIADAQKVVAMNPNHFGAWQGMGLCHVRLGELDAACRCMRAALAITPHDEALRKLLKQCEAVRQKVRPRADREGEVI